MQSPRIAILGQFLESNRYSPVVSRRKFRRLYGDDICSDVRSAAPKLGKEVVGFFQAMDEAGSWEPVPIFIALGGAGCPADAEFITEVIATTRNDLSACLPVDGVYIFNHGAMITTDDDDPDGRLYETVRNVVGPDVPVVTTVDLHANISERMVENADVIVSYRTDPHVDQYDRGQEAASVLGEMLRGMRPRVHHIRVPIVAPNVSLLTDAGPYGDLIDYGQSQAGPEILNVSIVAGFAYSDTDHNGLHVIVTARSDPAAAGALCVQLANMAWQMRERFLWRLTPIEAAVEAAVQAGEHPYAQPILLADLGDNIGAGGPGNTLWILEALYNARARGVLIGSFFDPELVDQATDAGVGSHIQAIFHGDGWDRETSQLVVDDARVLRLHAGQFRITLGPLANTPVNAGASCLLEVGDLLVLVTSRRPIVWPDPSLLEDLHVDIQTVRTLVLKCRSNYRAVFNRYFDADKMIEVDTPGRTSPVLTRHNWARIPRPSYPIDRDFQWSATVVQD